MVKTCSDCGVSGVLETFPKTSRYNDYPNSSAGRSSKCQNCLNAMNKKWVIAHPEDARKHQQEYHVRHRDQRNEQHRLDYEKNKVERLKRIREWKLKKCYGITSSDYELRVLEQGGKCAICLRPPTSKGLGVDHSHLTGKVRGLLCTNCNMTLGLMHDDVDALARAIDYLKRNGV